MSGLADRPLSELLEQVAARQPAPGGGSAAAWGCALAAALTEMAAAFALEREREAGGREAIGRLGERAAGLRVQALELAERELVSYRPVLEAMRLDAGAPERERRRQEALSQAATAPLEIAGVAAEVAELAAEAAERGGEQLRGDALTGVLLAEAASRAAAALVELNLAGASQDARLQEAGRLAGRGSAARRGALGE